ncbi:LLM class flavin-dependent oxidoreductase [Rossellomorea marisflavi]|uniref:LLM class flavin-dependent oxidoreductase n=1 Tax=Rossellomorea marisflavi TaxID=189381 RepID=UPI001318407F|nr:LLM class flavin-dependent oxidoreductase [Rossellomorea marisflavi]QHA35321.1 LLM class flavin-dependent oxidoreductase [Rossellomorea marisflavi]
MEIGLYSIGEHLRNPMNGDYISAQQRIRELIETAAYADEAGLDVFAVGESHQRLFTTQAHTVILGAIAQATKTIKIASSATVLSTSDPVRVYEDFATIDLISNGRAEIVAGRGSRAGAYELFGYDVEDYEDLFEEKIELLMQLNREENVTWEGRFRAPLRKATILPLATTSFLYTAKDSQTALREFYPHLNSAMIQLKGGGYPQDQFAAATDHRDALMIGSPQQIIEKILYQHELYGHQRFLGEIDLGGIPLDQIKKNIELIATDIMPSVKKYTAG